MRRNIFLVFLMFSLVGCGLSLILHDEHAAKKEAVKFGKIVFVQGDVEGGYQLLAEETRRTISLQQFKDTVQQMHPQSMPTTITATRYETIFGQRAVNIYLSGSKESEEFYYRLTMAGTSVTGYKVAGFFRGSGPNPSNKLRHSQKRGSNRPYPPLISREGEYAPPTHEQKMWALATCAVITEVNRQKHDLLGGRERTPEAVRAERKSLSEWWGVRSRDDLFEMLRWIEEGGHRKEFDELGKHLTSLRPDQLAAVRKGARADAERTNTLNVVIQYYPELGEKSIVGWDYARYVALCGWGYTAGYISEDEAWEKIMPAARLLQQTFDSWEDLGEDYMIGRQFWSLEQTRQRGQSFRQAYGKLTSNPASPWNKIPWNLDLTPQHIQKEAKHN